MKHFLRSPIRFIGALLLKLIYGPAYTRRWTNADYPYDDPAMGVESALSAATALWVIILVYLVISGSVPLHALVYLIAYPSALALWTLHARRQ